MKDYEKSDLFSLIHDFFKVYLPNQRKASKHTIRSYSNALEALLDFVKKKKGIKLSKVTFEMIDHNTLSEYLDSLELNGCSIATRNQRHYCIRAFYEYAANMEPTATVFRTEIAKVPIKKQADAKPLHHMSEAAVKTLLETPDAAFEKGFRDRTLLVLLYDSAARVQEILDVHVCDIRFGDVPTVILHGKGSKVRTVPIMHKTADHIQKYLQIFHPNVNQYSQEFLFYILHEGQKKRMNENTVRKLLQKYGKEAKSINAEVSENVHPHLLRHSRAMHLYQHGMELTLISQWLGHSSLNTTLVYAHADTEQKRKAIEIATTSGNPLVSSDAYSRFTVDDEMTLKRLCGLR
jgi:site-specific recombinase XerD